MADLTPEEIANLKEQIIERLNTEESLSNFQNFILGKDITIFLGNTRSGKSTLINYLIGNRLRSVRREDLPRQFRLELVEEDDGPQIGYGSLSVTDFPSVYSTSDGSVLIDSPGFEDNRGIPQDIFNALCVNQIRFANSIKFVLVCYIHDVANDNVRSFTNLLSQMTHLVTNIENIQNSVCIIFTKDNLNYTPEELGAIMRQNILNQNEFNIDRRLLRNLTQNNQLIGVFKMPAVEGDINLNELDVNIKGAIDACELVSVGELNIRFSLCDQSNLFLRAVYPEYTDTRYFDSEINKTVQEHNNYFDIDLYVFASYKDELDQVREVLRIVNDPDVNLREREMSSLDDLKRALETLLEARAMRLSFSFERSFQFMIALDNALLLEEQYRETIIQNYRNSIDALLLRVTRLSTKIDVEYETRRKNNFLFVYQASLFAGGVGPATLGILRFLQGIVPAVIPGAGGFATLEAGVGTVAASSACVVGGVAVGGAIGAAYMLIKDAIFRRRQVREEQNR